MAECLELGLTSMTPPQTQPGPDLEFQALVRSRCAGNPKAITELGARLCVGRDAPLAPVDGAALIAEAARQGDAEAWAYMAVLAATGVGRSRSWRDALSALDRATELGDSKALRQQQLLRAMALDSDRDVETWLAGSSGEILFDAPRLVTHAGFLTPALCTYLMERAPSKLVEAKVYDAYAGGLKVDPMRTNKGAVFSLIDTDLIIQLIRARIARAAGVAPEALEPPEILHYAVGERYKPHVDFFHPSLPNFAEQMRLKGQRIKTCLVYLNEDLEGGETEFPKIGVKFRGRIGDALIFQNVQADGTGDLRTLHAGLPPTRGEKWLLSQWIRNKPQPIA
ncbi:MAG: prolyl 4-hydroxylase [Betaproteobacteria bacterium]